MDKGVRLDNAQGQCLARDNLVIVFFGVERKHGVLLRAGQEPEIGDVNRQQPTPLLASVAHAIEPVSYFSDKALIALLGGPDARDRWERRFWPDA